MDISYNIKRVREAKGIKQIDVAKALELDPSYYARLEKRGNKMTIEQLEQIAIVLRTSIVELIAPDTDHKADNESTKALKSRISELEDDKDFLQTSIRLKDHIIRSNNRSMSQAIEAWKELYEVLVSIKPNERVEFDPYKLASLGAWLEVISSMMEDIESTYSKK